MFIFSERNDRFSVRSKNFNFRLMYNFSELFVLSMEENGCVIKREEKISSLGLVKFVMTSPSLPGMGSGSCT